MKIYFLLWEGLPCDEDGFITARMVGSELCWLDTEDTAAMWDNPEEPLAWIEQLHHPGSYKVYAVEI